MKIETTLEDWLIDPPTEAFREGKKKDYYIRYMGLKNYLNDNIHKHVEIGANLKDSDMVLNDHGPDHIASVIDKASYLARSKDCDLTALEVYILLVSILLHDAGNILGRHEHELKAKDIMEHAGNLCGSDDIERRIINKIVEAHGGKTIFGDKDTIGQLKKIDTFFDEEIRLQVIASILRFADELADGKARANAFALKTPGELKKSEVFHAYSLCLDTVLIKSKEKCIELYYKIPKDHLTRKFNKNDDKVYLLDEIYDRVLKMHLERIYCLRFCRKVIDIERISVEIVFYDKYVDVFNDIRFEVYDLGYPEAPADNLYSLCDSLKDAEGSRINGEYVMNHIEGVEL